MKSAVNVVIAGNTRALSTETMMHAAPYLPAEQMMKSAESVVIAGSTRAPSMETMMHVARYHTAAAATAEMMEIEKTAVGEIGVAMATATMTPTARRATAVKATIDRVTTKTIPIDPDTIADIGRAKARAPTRTSLF